ncbi:hypothetical protein BMETH_2022_0 [methanotrophic bacterial endosymbiont of Bathymodiolus sp.]|nr:hypothetical protein BMETH_2022_0 [methanotrophic bacterial endosymbiont of Bathymodiolus sp.]
MSLSVLKRSVNRILCVMLRLNFRGILLLVWMQKTVKLR